MAGRPKKSDAEKLVSVGLAIPPEIDAEIDEIVKKDGRIKGQVARLIFMRGWHEYKRTGHLIESQYSPAFRAEHLGESTEPPVRADLQPFKRKGVEWSQPRELDQPANTSPTPSGGKHPLETPETIRTRIKSPGFTLKELPEASRTSPHTTKERKRRAS